MSIKGHVSFLLPSDAALEMAVRAKSCRLAQNLSRETLSLRSGVSVSTIRDFERTGRISLSSLLQLADALSCLDAFSQTFLPPPQLTIEEIVAPARKRGRK